MRATPPVEVFKSAIAGLGLRATQPIKKGTRIMRMSGTRASDARVEALLNARKLRRDNPLQVGPSTYIILDTVPVAANHSCTPNAAIVRTNTLVALKSIKKGDEITFDYSLVVGRENEGWYMRCRCGADSCRTKIGAWTTIPKARLAEYKRARALPDFVLAEL